MDMALSDQNKNFLALLNKLGIDVKQFPDKTFDGLFDNVPEDINYFFDWFIENITPDNVLTQPEQAIYFQLESNHLIPLEDEMNDALLSEKPGFNDLCLNFNYINNLLTQDLEDLTKSHKALSRISADLETNYIEIKKKQNKMMEEITVRKKLIDTIKEQSDSRILHFNSKMDDVIAFLMKDSQFAINISSFSNLLEVEYDIFNKFKTCKFLSSEIFSSSKSDLLVELEEDLCCVDISLILSEGLLKERKSNLEFLKEVFQKQSSEKNFICNKCISNEGLDTKGVKENIKILEQEVFKKMKTLSYYKIKTISDDYKLEKINLNKCYMEHFNICINYVTTILKMNSWLLHILLKCMNSLRDTLNLKKQFYLKLSEYERNLSNDITTIELKKQRFKETFLRQNRSALVSKIKNVTNFKENPGSNEEAFKSINELLIDADYCNFVSYKFRNDLQSSIKSFFDNTLCGPTSQLLFTTVELLNKLQYCEEYENEVDEMIKKLAIKFVEAKVFISKSDRKKSLSWIKILKSPQVLVD